MGHLITPLRPDKTPKHIPHPLSSLNHFNPYATWFLTVMFPMPLMVAWYISALYLLRPRSCSAAVVALQASTHERVRHRHGALKRVGTVVKTWELPARIGISMDHHPEKLWYADGIVMGIVYGSIREEKQGYS